MMAREKEQPLLEEALLRKLDRVDFCLENAREGALGGLRPTDRAGSAVDWKDHAPYIQGDDLRRIDWKIAARSDKYLIRRSSDEQRLWHQAYVDVSASMGMDGKGETCFQLAAALGYLSVRRTDLFSCKLLEGNACRPAAACFRMKSYSPSRLSSGTIRVLTGVRPGGSSSTTDRSRSP